MVKRLKSGRCVGFVKVVMWWVTILVWVFVRFDWGFEICVLFDDGHGWNEICRSGSTRVCHVTNSKLDS